jgi:hypothetical protein
VLVSVNGQRVKDGRQLRLSVDRSKSQEAVVLRDGRRVTLTLPPL